MAKVHSRNSATWVGPGWGLGRREREARGVWKRARRWKRGRAISTRGPEVLRRCQIQGEAMVRVEEGKAPGRNGEGKRWRFVSTGPSE